MSKIPLSICIPTLNRADFLIKNLEAIYKLDKTVEINISDNASTDDTQEVVKKFVKRHPKVKVNYFRQKKTVGFDFNVLSVLKLATGDFCWMLGDDDLPAKGCIARIKKVIEKHPDLALIHMNFSRFDLLLQKVTSKKMVGDINRDMLFTDVNKFYFMPLDESYFKFLGTNVITMSTDIFNRKLALKVLPEVKKFMDLNFIQCFIASHMVKLKPKVYYFSKPQVQYLANNHRIWPNHIWQDYNNIFLDDLIKIGFNKNQVLEMQRIQRTYEKAEDLTRKPLFKDIYNFARPAISAIRYIRDRMK